MPKKWKRTAPWKKALKLRPTPFPIGSRGVFITCDGGMEKVAGAEAVDIFNRFYELLCPAQKAANTAHADGLTISGALDSELKELKSGRKECFHSWSTGLTGSVYIKFADDYDGPGPVELVRAILEKALTTGVSATRRCVRFFPVERCCQAAIEKIKPMASEMVTDVFKAGADVRPLPFAVDVDRRCKSDNVKRADVIDAFVDPIPRPPHAVNLSKPEHVIVVQVVRNVCAACVMEDYHKLCKCNVRQCCERAQQADGEAGRAEETRVGVKRKAENVEGEGCGEKRFAVESNEKRIGNAANEKSKPQKVRDMLPA